MAEASRTVVELDEQLRTRVERLASSRQVAVDVMLRAALQEFVEREERRADFCDLATAAWTEYQATGLHATFEEVDAWLARLENGDPAPPPKCRG